MCIGICPCISLSFCLQFFKEKKKPQSSSLQKERERFQAIHLFSVCSIHNFQRASIISGQHVLLPARRILRRTSSPRRSSISLSTWAIQLSVTSREFIEGYRSPLGLLCTMRFILVILLGGSFTRHY